MHSEPLVCNHSISAIKSLIKTHSVAHMCANLLNFTTNTLKLEKYSKYSRRNREKKNPINWGGINVGCCFFFISILPIKCVLSVDHSRTICAHRGLVGSDLFCAFLSVRFVVGYIFQHQPLICIDIGIWCARLKQCVQLEAATRHIDCSTIYTFAGFCVHLLHTTNFSWCFFSIFLLQPLNQGQMKEVARVACIYLGFKHRVLLSTAIILTDFNFMPQFFFFISKYFDPFGWS